MGVFDFARMYASPSFNRPSLTLQVCPLCQKRFHPLGHYDKLLLAKNGDWFLKCVECGKSAYYVSWLQMSQIVGERCSVLESANNEVGGAVEGLVGLSVKDDDVAMKEENPSQDGDQKMLDVKETVGVESNVGRRSKRVQERGVGGKSM